MLSLAQLANDRYQSMIQPAEHMVATKNPTRRIAAGLVLVVFANGLQMLGQTFHIGFYVNTISFCAGRAIRTVYLFVCLYL